MTKQKVQNKNWKKSLWNYMFQTKCLIVPLFPSLGSMELLYIYRSMNGWYFYDHQFVGKIYRSPHGSDCGVLSFFQPPKNDVFWAPFQNSQKNLCFVKGDVLLTSPLNIPFGRIFLLSYFFLNDLKQIQDTQENSIDWLRSILLKVVNSFANFWDKKELNSANQKNIRKNEFMWT